MLKRKIFNALLLTLTLGAVQAQDTNVLIGLNGLSYGVKIKNNFPGETRGFARAFMLSNQDASVDFFGFGVNGNVVNGVSTPAYGYIGQNYSNPMMSFLPNGDIGIGTLTPKEKLSVNGKIRAQEIKVEMANWPDYVFQKNYQLPTLEETESQIKLNGHLPGIPSAAEVKANGIEVGEMNAKLLKKIEELTLHLILKDKELAKERSINKDQEERLSRLESIITKRK